MNSIAFELPDHVTPEEARIALAISLFSSGRLTQGEAARLAGFSRESFLEILAKHGVSFTNISPDDLSEELETWRELRSRTARP